MKIAFVCLRFYPHIGGVEAVVLNLASNLAAKGIEVTVLTQTDNKNLAIEEKLNNFTIKRFFENGFSEIKFSYSLFKYLQKNSGKYDLIHSQNYHAFPSLYVAVTKKSPIVFSPHYHGKGHKFFTNLLHYPYRFAGRFIFSNANVILCDTYAEVLLIKKHFQFLKNITVIPLGIDIKGIQTAKKNNNTSRYILSVGRLERYKNVELIIRSLQYLKNNINLLIVGYGTQMQNLKNLSHKLNLSSRITFIENISNEKLYSYIKNAEAYVTMSSMEAYGLSLLEAVSAGIGIVASDIPPHRELINRFDIKNVSLLNPDSSPEKLASIIDKSLNELSSAQKELPSWQIVTEQTLGIYKNVLKINKK